MMGITTLLYTVVALIFIVFYYLIILTDMKKKEVIVTYISLFLVAVATFLIVNLVLRKKLETDLAQICAVATIESNMEQRLSNTSNYGRLLSEIDDYEQRLKDLRSRKSIFDKLYKCSDGIDTLVSQTLHLLNLQKNRIIHLNSKSNYVYNPHNMKDASSELELLSSDALNRDFLNSGFRINNSAIFVENNIILVRIVEQDKDSILYQQSYVPKDSINSFVLPNLFVADNIELQMGYISKNDTSTYHYIHVKPYGK